MIERTYTDPWFTDYIGTKEELVNAGLARDEYFPDGKKPILHYSNPIKALEWSNWEGWVRTKKLGDGRYELTLKHKRRPQTKHVNTDEQSARRTLQTDMKILFGLFDQYAGTKYTDRDGSIVESDYRLCDEDLRHFEGLIRRAENFAQQARFVPTHSRGNVVQFAREPTVVRDARTD